jgi:peptidyl-prolyl cis-trans isomerase SurA
MHKYGFLILSALLLVTGCGGNKPKLTEAELERIPLAQKTGLPECSGGFVLAVCGETITADEIITPLIGNFRSIAQTSNFEQFKERARPELEKVVVTKVSNILLYQQAKKQAGENIDERLEKLADSEVRKFVVGFGGDYARAEEALKQMGMDWRSFKEYQKKMILSQSYVSSQLPDKKAVSHSELMDCYNEMKEKSFTTPAILKFRLIDIQPAKLEVTDPNKDRLDQARELANELIGRLQAGEDFDTLAKQYSHGYRREFGGLWKPVQPESLAEPYDILAVQAEKIEPGQIAGPIETSGHIFIMKLEEKQPKTIKPFREVQKEIEAKIVFERRKNAVDELGDKLVQQAALGKEDEFIDFCVGEIYRLSNQ